jgi:osmotically-inducible protein OsmY
MNKPVAFVTGSLVGASLAYLFDPDRGRSRRSRLSDQAAALARDTAETAKSKLEYQAGVATGAIHDLNESFRADRTFDDDTLLQKVRSEVLGYWDLDGIEIDVRDGHVTITGPIHDEASRRRLVTMIRDVEGVDLVDDRLRSRV